jgi:fumarate hydratase class II
MGARKLYEEKILELIKNIPEEELPQVVTMIEKIKEEKRQKYLQAIKEGRGKFKDILPSTEEFLKRKHEDKLLDR